MSAGGIHFKKSFACLVGTGIFVEVGVRVAGELNMDWKYIVLVYIACIIILAVIGPQGTENNPILEENYRNLRKRTIFIVTTYLLITVCMLIFFRHVPYLLFVAVVFETFSLLPSYIKNRNIL